MRGGGGGGGGGGGMSPGNGQCIGPSVGQAWGLGFMGSRGSDNEGSGDLVRL